VRQEFKIGRPDVGRRVDRYLQKALGDVPSSLVQKLIRKGKVRRLDVRVQAADRLKEGDVLVVHHQVQAAGPARAVSSSHYAGADMKILYRDDDYLALDKPAGIRCSEDDDPSTSVQQWLREELKKEIAAGEVRPELCHRLDEGTTGVVLVALTAAAVSNFHEALRAGTIHKEYRVVVWGEAPSKKWSVERPLHRMAHARSRDPKVMIVDDTEPGAQPAHTEFRVLAKSKQATLLAARPITGRTHQIRAHLKGTGLPVVGDARYGDWRLDQAAGIGKVVDHQLLHARSITLPGESEITVEAPVPKEFRKILEKLAVRRPADL